MQVLSESLNWMAIAFDEFGLQTIDVKVLIDNMMADLSSSNVTVRNAAINVLMTALEDAFKRNPQEQVLSQPELPAAKSGSLHKVFASLACF